MLRLVAALFVFPVFIFASSKNQEFSDFTIPLPLHPGDTLILGIVGGWERWDAEQRGVRKTALELRAMKWPGAYVETVENHKIFLAHELIDKAFDWNKNGKLDPDEVAGIKLILFGQSLGGEMCVMFSKELEAKGIAVQLVVMIDAFGHNRPIPRNVRAAVNMFQRESWPIVGLSKIVAEDPSATKILGNFQWKYWGKDVDIAEEPWVRRTFVRAHEKMEFDPLMWNDVKRFIETAFLAPQAGPTTTGSAPPAARSSGTASGVR